MTIWVITAERLDAADGKTFKVAYKKFFLGVCYSTIEDIYTFD